MLECLVLGDSIALGTSQYLKCEVSAVVGANSKFIASQSTNPADYTLISLGSNDPNGNFSYYYAIRLRNKLCGHKVVWILPNALKFPDQHLMVLRLADAFGDGKILLDVPLSPDGVHPTSKGYKKLADQFRSVIVKSQIVAPSNRQSGEVSVPPPANQSLRSHCTQF